MTTGARVKALVADLIAGTDVRSAWDRLSRCGRAGTDALLDALEGRAGPFPKDRHPIDVSDDLSGGLQTIAAVNPAPLIRALDRRPEHAFSLAWALGSSREDAAIATLTTLAKHKDLWVRWAAIEGLARLRRKSVLPTLLDALHDRSDWVRFAALEGLAKIPDRAAIEPLRRYLAYRRLQPGARRIAGELLAKLERGRALAHRPRRPPSPARAPSTPRTGSCGSWSGTGPDRRSIRRTGR